MIRFLTTRRQRNALSWLAHSVLSITVILVTLNASADDSLLSYSSVNKTAAPKVMELDGEIEAVNQATVAAQTSGRIVELAYDVGDYVPANSVIARLTSVEQAAQLDAAQSQQSEAETLLEEATDNFERARSVFAKKLISEAEFDRAEANVKASQAKAKAARAAVTAARETLAYTAITAPYAGIVIERLVQTGETVAPGTPIMSGVSLNELRAVVHVPQLHIGPVRQHQQAQVVLPNGKTVDAVDMRIPPRADTNSHTFRVLVDLPEDINVIFPGTLVKVRFVTGKKERLTIPREALVKRGEITAVYVVGKDNLLTLRYVRIGEATAERVAILSGLQEGDRIATNPVVAASAYKAQHIRGDADR